MEDPLIQHRQIAKSSFLKELSKHFVRGRAASFFLKQRRPCSRDSYLVLWDCIREGV